MPKQDVLDALKTLASSEDYQVESFLGLNKPSTPKQFHEKLTSMGYKPNRPNDLTHHLQPKSGASQMEYNHPKKASVTVFHRAMNDHRPSFAKVHVDEGHLPNYTSHKKLASVLG